MALRASRPDRRAGQPHRPKGGRYGGDTITAAAENIYDRLTKSNSNQIGESWQAEAWSLFRDIPEMRAASRITAQAMSQCRLVIARPDPAGGEPSPLDLTIDKETGEPTTPDDYNHPAVKWLTGFAGGMLGQAALLDQLGVFFTVSGEGILVGALDPMAAARNADPFLRMQAYSEQQVRIRNKEIAVRMDESTQADRIIERGDNNLGVNGETAIRIWRPDPELSWRADSATRSALGVLGEIRLMDAHIRATAISRLVSAGLLLVPEGMTLPGTADDDADPDSTLDPFMLLLIEMFSLAIKDPDSAAAKVPILLRGEKEDLDAIRHLTMSTPFDAEVRENRKDAVGRYAVAVDMPGEILTGFGSLQHWTGALITDEWKNGTLSSLMMLTVGSITMGALYPYLAQVDPTQPADVIVWFDDSSVRTRENTGAEAQQAYQDGVIGAPTYRRALGFDETDAPIIEDNPRDFVQQMLVKAPAALAPLLLPYLGIVFTPKMLEQAKRIAETVGGGDPAPPGGNGGAVGGVPADRSTGAEPQAGSVPGMTAAGEALVAAAFERLEADLDAGKLG